MAKMSSSVVSKWWLTTMPPRRPVSKPESWGELTVRGDACGDDDEVAVERVAFVEDEFELFARWLDGGGAFAEKKLDILLLDGVLEKRGGGFVELTRHQERGALDDGCFETELLDRLRGFEAKETATDDGGFGFALSGGDDGFEIGDVAVEKNIRMVATGDGWHEGARAGSEDEGIVVVLGVVREGDALQFGIDGDDLGSGEEGDALFLIPIFTVEDELLGILVFDVGREVDAVVGGEGFFADDSDFEKVAELGSSEVFAELASDHSIADHNQARSLG